MIDNSLLAEAIKTYKDTVDTAIAGAREVRLPAPLSFSFNTRDLSPEVIESLAGKIDTKGKIGQAIYIFRLSCSTPCKKISKEFENARAIQQSSSYRGKKNLCKPNKGNEGPVLYVGRSENPRGRFKEHLRTCEYGTYSMHLASWASSLEIMIDFELYNFVDVHSNAVQIVEDALWDHLRPMLGRRGQR